MSNITLSKSEEQAAIITIINQYMQMLDPEYLREAATEIGQKADQYDTMAVLNRMWSPHGAELFRKESSALKHLVGYIEDSMKITELRAKKGAELNELSKFFM